MNQNRQTRATAIVGSYRKDGAIDSAVTCILKEIQSLGLDTEKIYLLDQHIEYCSNCRVCMQTEGKDRGRCIIDDDMNALLDRIEQSEYLIIGAPVNMSNVNALTRTFMERCAGYGYWPWEEAIPKFRSQSLSKKSLLVSASAAPAWIGRWFTSALPALKMLSKLLNAKPVGVLWIGGISEKHTQLTKQQINQAQRLARKLID